jgi:hypothetical protein
VLSASPVPLTRHFIAFEQPRAATVSFSLPEGSRRCTFCCDWYNPETHTHCLTSHITTEKPAADGSNSESSSGGAAAAAAASRASCCRLQCDAGSAGAGSELVAAIAAREQAHLSGKPLSDPVFDTLMALKCDLLDVEAAIPWEVMAHRVEYVALAVMPHTSQSQPQPHNSDVMPAVDSCFGTGRRCTIPLCGPSATVACGCRTPGLQSPFPSSSARCSSWRRSLRAMSACRGRPWRRSVRSAPALCEHPLQQCHR